MASNIREQPPPLEDPNSPDYVCTSCKNDVLNLCLECLGRINMDDIKAMIEKNLGRPLTYAPAFNVNNDRLLSANTETSEDALPPNIANENCDHSGYDGPHPTPDDETDSWVGHMTTFEDPASPDPTPSNPEVMSVDASDENSERNNVAPRNKIESKVTNVEKKSEETNNNDSNLGDISNIIELSERLTPTQFGECANCANLDEICTTANAKTLLEWIEEAKKYAAMNETECEINKLLNALKVNMNHYKDNNEAAPLGKIVDTINDIDE